jgi:hypothetical protein
MEAHAPASFGSNKVATFRTNSTIKKFYTQMKKETRHGIKGYTMYRKQD